MTDFNLFSKAPEGELYTKWEEYKNSLKKLTPEEANKYKIIVIGTGLAGASASATLAKAASTFMLFLFTNHQEGHTALQRRAE